MKSLALAVLLSFCTMMSFCQNSKNNPEKGLLWEISGNGLSEKSYLFGTWHGTPGVCIDFLDSIPGFYKVFDSVTQYVGENINNKGVLDALTETLGEKFMPHNIKYNDLLNEEDIQFLDSVLIKYIDAEASDVNIRPNHLYYILNIFIIQKAYIETENEKCKIIMDLFLIQQALDKNYPTEALDTPEIAAQRAKDLYLKNYKPGITLKENADYLVQELKIILSQEEDMQLKAITEKMENAYRNMDLNILAKYKNQSMEMIKELYFPEPEFDEIYQFMAIGRNKLWMEKIPELINKQPSFIAVGALHLPGEEGLINLLRKQGYTVNPVN